MTELKIRDFAPGDEHAFRELNEAWIRAYFSMEEQDHAVLNDPVGQILDKGGAIVIADREGRVVGCCALLPHGTGCLEIGKMAVAEDVRGLGVGKKILAYAVGTARRLGAKKLYLETNDRLQNAIHLYKQAGFRRLAPEEVQTSPYARSNVAMEMIFDD